MPQTRQKILSNPQQDLNSVLASRVLDSFQNVHQNSKRGVQRDIATLKQSEQEFSERTREATNQENEARVAQLGVEDALANEQYALEMLEQAKQAVEQAKRDIDYSKREANEAAQKAKVAHVALTKATTSLTSGTEKLRVALKKVEDEELDTKATMLKEEIGNLEVHSKELYVRAKEIGLAVAERKREEAKKR